MAQQWEVRYSNSRSRPYFYNPTTQESLWEAPPSLTVDEVLALPGSEHITNPTPAALAAAGILAKASKSDGSAAVGKVRASHLLVKYDRSRRPSSWKTKVITRNKVEATAMIESYRALLEGEGDLKSAFAKLAETESDCSSARDGGDLGWFGKGSMQKPFEDATYATLPGQMSPVIWSDSGAHIIYRTG